MSLCGPPRRRKPAGGGIPLRGYVEKILQDQVAMLGGDALGMELHAVHRIAAVVHPHDQGVGRFRCHFKILREVFAIDDERVIARRPERPVDAVEDTCAGLPDFGELAVHRNRRPDHAAAKSLADGLVAEADAKDRNVRGGALDQIEADAGLVGRAWTGRQHDGVGVAREHVIDADLIIAMDIDLRPQAAQVMDEVEGEAVIVVDQQDHDPRLSPQSGLI